MALQFGHRIGRHVCANNFSLRARSYSSRRLPPVSAAPSSTGGLPFWRVPAYRITVETAGYCVYFGWLLWFDTFGIRERYAEWKGEKKRLEMLEKLDRGKYESSDAYLEMLEREVDALKARLLTRFLHWGRRLANLTKLVTSTSLSNDLSQK